MGSETGSASTSAQPSPDRSSNLDLSPSNDHDSTDACTDPTATPPVGATHLPLISSLHTAPTLTTIATPLVGAQHTRHHAAQNLHHLGAVHRYNVHGRHDEKRKVQPLPDEKKSNTSRRFGVGGYFVMFLSPLMMPSLLGSDGLR
ncbi:Os03g0676633 [Oryza sativa Japonica Group]|uniref:Uncharacterized protein n=2 Tax=Oryza sativa subsp. japonica TaxID=39947 RepID=A3ALC8_ORYSJ|nr:hypothetical protein [Oryza sativa Japonica Group]ABF98168.1 hypothetical protein LOC_Os03g47290 [Oryza sativa Japonica Group]EAZ28117.1 hypothetical protein OsJ_12086 [Oryza sativa Japonica Group]BAS85726.1 Os03g0676633 [Oryza sativa Japonica Group]